MTVKKSIVVAVAIAALAFPAYAKSLTASDVGLIFCVATLADDMAPVEAILTPDLAEKLKATGGPIRWQAKTDYANQCQPVGVSGTGDQPEIILSYNFLDETKPGYTQSIVMKFVEGRLRIDDIKFPDQTTLRSTLP